MKNIFILFLSIILLGFSSCKLRTDQEICEDSFFTLKIETSSQGIVKHPLSDGILIVGERLKISPSFQNQISKVDFSEIDIIYNNLLVNPDSGNDFVEFLNIAPGNHHIEMNVKCTKSAFKNHFCKCSDTEEHASIDLPSFAPSYVRIDYVIYSKELPCNFDFPLFPCPDIEYKFGYYPELYFLKYNHDFSYFGALTANINTTIAIFPSDCIIPLVINDNNDAAKPRLIEEIELNPTNMGQWNTGIYDLTDYLQIKITRL